MTTNHLILDFRMYIAMKTYQRIPAYTGWTALKLKSVICIVPDRRKRKSEKNQAIWNSWNPFSGFRKLSLCDRNYDKPDSKGIPACCI